MTTTTACPSCSAPIQIESRFSQLVICPYCAQTISLSRDGIQTGKQASLLGKSRSILSLGCSGMLATVPFKVIGRLQFQSDNFFWDEWYCQIGEDDRESLASFLWLQEDDGMFTAFRKELLRTPLPPFEEVSVGSMINVNDHSLFVTERGEAVVTGGEGELHFRIEPGVALHFLDGNAAGKLMSVEFFPDEICLSMGESLSPSDIKLV